MTFPKNLIKKKEQTKEYCSRFATIEKSQPKPAKITNVGSGKKNVL